MVGGVIRSRRKTGLPCGGRAAQGGTNARGLALAKPPSRTGPCSARRPPAPEAPNAPTVVGLGPLAGAAGATGAAGCLPDGENGQFMCCFSVTRLTSDKRTHTLRRRAPRAVWPRARQTSDK
jgi:hypothetical protein